MGAMAEYFVGPVMERIIDTCFEYFKDQTCMEEKLQKLRDIHPQIKAVVSAYNQAQIEDPALDKWLWQLRDAIDEADDVLDDLKYRKHKNQVSNNNNRTEKVIKVGQRAGKNDPYLMRLEVAVQKLDKASAKVSNLHHLLENRSHEQQLQQLEMRETGSMPANDLLGRRVEIEFLRWWLGNPCRTGITNTGFYRNISVLSVVGHGGMGKTTLSQHVFSDRLTEVFDVKIWVCVSTNFKAKTVITSMLQFLKRQVSEEEPLAALQSSLQSEVMSKRFLLVLDDIWEEDERKWENVFAPLRYGSSGSKILITTRLDSVASKFARMIGKSEGILRLINLEEDECLRLFNAHAFAGVDKPNDEFKSIAVKMVQKISGCPLAAKVIGCILNDYMDECYWKKVLNSNIGDVESDHNYIMPVLKLSYIHLPKFLQNCFSFCSIFEKDHEFYKDDLVRMWIALGFIQSSNIREETLEETGRRYFNILVQMSFFKKFWANDDKFCYKMPGLLYELAQSISQQEIFSVKSGKELSIAPDTIRHLSITVSYDCLPETFEKMREFKKLRTLFLFSMYEIDDKVFSKIFKAVKNIRLLYLRLPKPRRPKTISSLIHLRYLKVDCVFWLKADCHDFVLKLLSCISQLYHLQFLISKTFKIGLKELTPNENCQIIMDEFIIEDPSVLLMKQISIRSIPFLRIEENDELVSFPFETDQWFLQYSSSLFGLRFCGLKSLQSLPSSLKSFSSLQTLELYRLQSLQCLPSSLSTISSLKCLKLYDIQLVKSLPVLPFSLKILEIERLESLQCLPPLRIFYLEYLKLKDIPRLESLSYLPSSLDHIELTNLVSFHSLPSFLSTISSLQFVILKNIPLLKSLPDLPDLLKVLYIEDCHPQLMERYENFDRT